MLPIVLDGLVVRLKYQIATISPARVAHPALIDVLLDGVTPLDVLSEGVTPAPW